MELVVVESVRIDRQRVLRMERVSDARRAKDEEFNLPGASRPERDPSASEGPLRWLAEDLVVVEGASSQWQRAVKLKEVSQKYYYRATSLTS